MTCIAAIAEGGKVWLGADSAGIDGLSIRVRADSKLFEVGDEMLIGVCGSFRVRDILRYQFAPPAVQKDDLTDYMVTDFVEAYRSVVKMGGSATVVDNHESAASDFIVGFRGRLFTIHSDFQVAEQNDPFHAVGCGSDIALGSLYSTRRLKLTPKERILRALQASARYSGGVCAPFKVKSL